MTLEETPSGRHPLVEALHWPEPRTCPSRRSAASGRELQALTGSPPHRERPQRRRALRELPTPRPAVRRRRLPDPSPGPHRADPAAAARDARAAHRRPSPQRTTNLYAALDVASVNVIANLSARHRPRSCGGSSISSTMRCRPTTTCTSWGQLLDPQGPHGVQRRRGWRRSQRWIGSTLGRPCRPWRLSFQPTSGSS